MDISKRDWKLFREKLPEWQEAYMERLIQEYILLLNSDEKASTKFWALEKRIKENKKDTGVLCEIRRSVMINNLINLLYEGAITYNDLSEFSDDIKDTIDICTHGKYKI